MNILTQKLKATILAVVTFCMACTATACDLSQFLPNASSSITSESTGNSTNDSVVSSSIGENSDSSSTSEEDSSIENNQPTEEQLRMEQIMNQAYALLTGSSLQGTYQLSGVVSYIDTEYKSNRGVSLYINVDEPQGREIYCYRLTGEGADTIAVGDFITVSGTIKNYQGTIEFEKPTLVSVGEGNVMQGGILPDPNGDPYANVSWSSFYANYTPATSNVDAYYRSLHGFLSGDLTVPDQAPTLSAYRPKQGNVYIRNDDTLYEEDGNAYVVTDVYGHEVFTVYKEGGYITLEEVAAYVYAFGTFPANHSASKSTKPTASIWGKYLRLNHSKFSGSTTSYPYEPELPNITGCGGTLQYYEMDIGTTGTDCDPSYTAVLYNNGSSITRGAARIVYGKNDLNGNGVYDVGELYLFYTYNHYNDFQEYLNYANGWGEMFGNITGGGTISSKYDYNPTDYVEVYWGTL